MTMIYKSPDPYFDAFEQPIGFRKFDLTQHPTAGLSVTDKGGCLHVMTMSPGTPTAKIPAWHSRIRGACLIKIGHKVVSNITDASLAFVELQDTGVMTTNLLLAHPDIRPNFTHDGLPIATSAPFSQTTHNQLNDRWEFTTVAAHLCSSRSSY